ncbi:uncharacterized protein CIMG_11923 [Coccidioides immitis RS]|uniref:Uncharacterized protein n=4 Tax=Coccidioides immitis TaxID=5501 RepID=A0A0D8JTM2_COCIM|nr:uncharacterized protein CIMG_11923 [Coccidioides immitis RS]KMP02359.1 hypothetical protein CIRG_10182 [Coccidioides immitis RMSCC 2394]KMU73585.1 hypothetical protein CISG_10043 [Coccidioides immitis RMSCC 3703]KMU92661.1 hypothetical protein CIHG_10371 [Coccidioides immitis H538.4]TPX24488.1 hypothetical protein DIZ76_013835 [Coccidioides immitis]KJF60680.1 hypothetical protein CIMG_11923 [Coccidioides immitis RS]
MMCSSTLQLDEDRAASHAAELKRVEKHAHERAAQAAEEVRAERDAERERLQRETDEQAARLALQQEAAEMMARRVREAAERTPQGVDQAHSQGNNGRAEQDGLERQVADVSKSHNEAEGSPVENMDEIEIDVDPTSEASEYKQK